MSPGDVHFDSVLAQHIRGGAFSDINVLKSQYYHKRTGSLFEILCNIFRRTIPFLTNYVLPEAGNFVENIAEDYRKISLRKSLKMIVINSVENIGNKIMRGGVRIRLGNANVNNITNGCVVRRKNMRKNAFSHCMDVFGHMNN